MNEKDDSQQPEARGVVDGWSDEMIIAICKTAGVPWIEPDTDEDGNLDFPGAFDLIHMPEMRRLLAAAQQQGQAVACCMCDPTGADGQACPDATGTPLCCTAPPSAPVGVEALRAERDLFRAETIALAKDAERLAGALRKARARIDHVVHGDAGMETLLEVYDLMTAALNPTAAQEGNDHG